MNASDRANRDKSDVASIRNMIAPPGVVPEFPPNLAKARAGHDGLARIFPILEGTTFTPVDLGGVKGEAVTPANRLGEKVILYFHGWGYALGSLSSHRHLVAQLAFASKSNAYALDYGLAPECPYPRALNDALAAYGALLAQGVAPRDIVFSGDSSGGGLALGLAIALKAHGLPQPAGLFLMSPWVDLSLTGESHRAKAQVDFMCNYAELEHWAKLYISDRQHEHCMTPPTSDQLAGLAPVLIHVGSEEILYSDSLQLAHNVGLAGGQVQLSVGANMPHTWHYMWPFVTAARQAIADAGRWIEAL